MGAKADVEPIKTEELHPAYVAHEMALKAWADALNADMGLLAHQRIGNPASADQRISELRRAARHAYRAWKLAGMPLYAIKPKF